MSCGFEREKISAYVDRELPEAERQQVAAHLLTCPSCNALAAEFTAIKEAIAASPRVPLDRDLLAGITAGLAAPADLPPRPRRATPRVLGSLAAAAMVVFVIGYMLIDPRTKESMTPHLADGLTDYHAGQAYTETNAPAVRGEQPLVTAASEPEGAAGVRAENDKDEVPRQNEALGDDRLPAARTAGPAGSLVPEAEHQLRERADANDQTLVNGYRRNETESTVRDRDDVSAPGNANLTIDGLAASAAPAAAAAPSPALAAPAARLARPDIAAAPEAGMEMMSTTGHLPEPIVAEEYRSAREAIPTNKMTLNDYTGRHVFGGGMATSLRTTTALGRAVLPVSFAAAESVRARTVPVPDAELERDVVVAVLRQKQGRNFYVSEKEVAADIPVGNLLELEDEIDALGLATDGAPTADTSTVRVTIRLSEPH